MLYEPTSGTGLRRDTASGIEEMSEVADPGIAHRQSLAAQPNGPAFTCEPQRLRGPPEAPELQCQRLAKVDWSGLWVGSCSDSLGRAPRRLQEAME